MSMTPPAWYLPPPDTLSGNHPELAVHPRMNSRSEHIASYYVRAPITFLLSCHAFDCYVCFIFTVSPPPYSPVDPAADDDYTAAEYDYYVDDLPLPSSFQAIRAILFPRYHLSFPYFLALGIVTA